MRAWVSAPVDPNEVMVQNFTASGFTIAPMLPAGLVLDLSTGTIAGTPEVTSAAVQYGVTVYRAGVALVITSVTIEVYEGTAPSGLAYTPAMASVPQGGPLPAMLPALNGVAEVFTVAPPLPDGVALDPLSGRIAGACNGAAGTTQHTVTATNPHGDTQATIEIEVIEALGLRGFLVPTAGDPTLDVFQMRNNAPSPIDTLDGNGATAIAAAATHDGRFVFAALSNGNLYRAERDLASGRTGELALLGPLSAARHLCVTPDGRHLVVVRENGVTRYDVGVDGSLCCESTVPGLFGTSDALLASNDVLIVATSFPGRLAVYEVSPTLQQRGETVDVGAEVLISGLANFDAGRVVYAATSSYNIATSTFQGRARNFRVSTASEVAGGSAAVVETQSIPRGRDLTDVLFADMPHFGARQVVFLDGSLGQVHVFDCGVDGVLSTAGIQTFAVGGRPIEIARGSALRQVVVLDEAREELQVHSLAQGELELVFRTRTRRQPTSLTPLVGGSSTYFADDLFIASATQSSLTAARNDLTVPGGLTLSSQPPVMTGARPVAVVSNDELGTVYTANRDGGSVSVFSFDEGTQQLSLVEHEQFAPGARPISLALTPAGRHLVVLDESGAALTYAVSQVDGSLEALGSLALTGDLSDAVVRIDPLGRFAYFAQPNAGLVSVATLNLSGGFLSSQAPLTTLSTPADVWLPIDGRFAYVVDRQFARVVAYSVDAVSGELAPLGSMSNVSGAPTRLTTARGVDTLHLFPGSAFFAFDPQGDEARAVDRTPLTGLLSASLTNTAQLPLGATALVLLDQTNNGRAMAATSDDGTRGFLTTLLPAFSTGVWSAATSVEIARGPHSIATLASVR